MEAYDVRTSYWSSDVCSSDLFNNGEIDALVLTTAGCNGISVHASPRFQDTRQRSLYIWHAPNDIIKLMQALGRPNRRDQVSSPRTAGLNRSEERRVGNECDSKRNDRWRPET